MPNVDTKVYNSQAKMREFIRRERQVELAFEGQRFYDIRRWKIGEQVLNGTVYGAVDPATGKPVVVEQRKFNPQRDYLWPIPLAEINANPKMTQNPNWYPNPCTTKGIKRLKYAFSRASRQVLYK